MTVTDLGNVSAEDPRIFCWFSWHGPKGERHSEVFPPEALVEADETDS